MPNPGQQQFRYSQTPSKVLHFRNLPWECTEEELVDLCRPFGSIVNTKCNVGPNSNQAFVEFVDLNQAISMATYFASSSEPAKIRGKSVYIQYSNRHEIVNHKSPGDVPGNVLLVTMGGVEPNDISIEVIHLVFSAFGFVHKIATFEKAAGFQALIQYTDAETACKAKESLDGRSIPRYLLPQHVQECLLRISYSAHTDLIIKFQSIRSRDYTNAYLPVNPSIMQGLVQPAVGLNGTNMGPQSNVLLAAIENMQYAVTVDVLHTVFSSFGTVQKIAIFEKNGGTQVLVQYPDVATATVAKDALQGHCIYDGGYCKLHLTYSHHTDLNVKDSDRSRDFTIPSSGMPVAPQAPVLPGAATTWQNPHAAAVHPGGGFANGEGMQPQTPLPNAYSWDPTMQAGRSTFISGPPVATGQPYVTGPPGAYATTPNPTASSSHANISVQNSYPVGVTQHIHQPNIVPGVVSPPGQPPW